MIIYCALYSGLRRFEICDLRIVRGAAEDFDRNDIAFITYNYPQ